MTIQDQLNQAATIINGNAWGIANGKPRIYMPSRKDAKIYFEFPDAAYTTPADEVSATVCLGGARLVVWIADCGQHPNWYTGQKKAMRTNQQKAGLALAAFIYTDDAALAESIMEADEVSEDVADAMVGHFINGRTEEALQAFAATMV